MGQIILWKMRNKSIFLWNILYWYLGFNLGTDRKNLPHLPPYYSCEESFTALEDLHMLFIGILDTLAALAVIVGQDCAVLVCASDFAWLKA